MTDRFKAIRRQIEAESKQKLRDNRLAQGLCIICGKNAQTDGLKSCDVCRARANIYRKRCYDKKKQEKQDTGKTCVYCWQSFDGQGTLCPECAAFYEKIRKATGTLANYGGHDGYENLGKAIIHQAANEYRFVLDFLEEKPDSKIAQSTKQDLEKFFKSQWADTLNSGESAAYILKLLHQEHDKGVVNYGGD